VGALSIPSQLRYRTLNSVVTSSTLLWTLAIVLIAVTDIAAVAVGGCFAAGMSWVCVFASLSAGTQSTAPAWVRARAVAMNLVAVQTSLALGSVLWGALASSAGTRVALGASAATMIVLLGLTLRVRVTLGSEAEVTPGVKLPEMAHAIQPMPDDGPVLIQVEYQVDPDHREAFFHAMQAVEPTRRRNGAVSWRVFRDLGEEGRFVERFIIDSWAEYVRLRTRATVADRMTHTAIEQFQRPAVPIRVSRFIGIDLSDVGLDSAPAHEPALEEALPSESVK
jgi:quinol monooxygenase YgiN